MAHAGGRSEDEIPLGWSFKYMSEHAIKGFVVYYNEGLDKPGYIQQSVAFEYGNVDEGRAMEAFLNHMIRPCIEKIIDNCFIRKPE